MAGTLYNGFPLEMYSPTILQLALSYTEMGQKKTCGIGDELLLFSPIMLCYSVHKFHLLCSLLCSCERIVLTNKL